MTTSLLVGGSGSGGRTRQDHAHEAVVLPRGDQTVPRLLGHTDRADMLRRDDTDGASTLEVAVAPPESPAHGFGRIAAAGGVRCEYPADLGIVAERWIDGAPCVGENRRWRGSDPIPSPRPPSIRIPSWPNGRHSAGSAQASSSPRGVVEMKRVTSGSAQSAAQDGKSSTRWPRRMSRSVSTTGTSIEPLPGRTIASRTPALQEQWASGSCADRSRKRRWVPRREPATQASAPPRRSLPPRRSSPRRPHARRRLCLRTRPRPWSRA